MTRAPAAPALELWGGIECTVNRVGDAYVDQLERCGHATRIDDLDRIAELGIKTLRYPVLWERTAPSGIDGACWEWADARLARLRALGIDPIVGLLHHGSGPRGTSLVDPSFPEALARYAGAVARRYPWVRRWTPINEPLTTARFGTLYALWYPHDSDDASFARAVMNQYRAIVLAMRAIREVIPDAELVQTEDLGRVYGPDTLRYQVEFENERRWLTFDALSGRLGPRTPMGSFLKWAGISADELERLRDATAAPAILGINHYLTSERYLDDRLDRYPPEMHGGNSRDAYVDVEAVRVNPEGIAGPGGMLREAWERYHLPLAITEAHAACTREQQMRWLGEVWSSASGARAQGVDVRAVTVWALLGAYDWDSLVTSVSGRYEPGAFDLRSASARPTAIARMARALATRGAHEHPALEGPGWWRTDRRFVSLDSAEPLPPDEEARTGRPILVTGATGTLGQAFARLCDERELAFRATSRAEMEISDAASVRATLDAVNPWAVVNSAGFVRVDDAEGERDACIRDNVTGAALLAEACAARGIPFVSFSSDLVFGGEEGRDRPYVESDVPAPIGQYGASKAEAERRIRTAHADALVIRTSAFFGPWDEHNFVTRTLRALEDGIPVPAPFDEIVSPTYVPDLVTVALDLLIDGERGVWHLVNEGAVSWAELARLAAERAGLNGSARLVQPCAGGSLGRAARRPRYSALASERGRLMPSLDEALTRYVAARAACIQMM